MQAGSITTNLKVEIDFILPEISVKKIMTCYCHVDESAKGRYDMMLSRDLLTALELNLKLSDPVIESDDGIFKGSMAPKVNMGTY